MLAAWKTTNPEIIKVLLAAGANATITDKNGHIALEYANINPKLRGTDAYSKLMRASYK